MAFTVTKILTYNWLSGLETYLSGSKNSSEYSCPEHIWSLLPVQLCRDKNAIKPVYM